MKLHVALWLAFAASAWLVVACTEDSPARIVSPPSATFDAGTFGAGPADDAGSHSDGASSAIDAATAIAPILDEQPRDRTVVAGRSAAFRVAAQGTNLGFVWECSNDHGSTWANAGSTLAEHTVVSARPMGAAAGGDDGARFRVTVANALGSVTSNPSRLTVIPIDASARVYTQHSSTVLWEHDVSTLSGAGYTATADLAAGTFTARSDGTSDQQSAYSGMHTVRFINHQATTVTLPAGSVKVAYAGSYSHSPQAPTLSAANSRAALSAAISPASQLDRIASLGHSANTPAPNPTTLSKEEYNGGTVVVQAESATTIQAELRLGELVIPPGESLSISFTLTTSASQAIVDFESTGGARISIQLPPGVHLDDTSSVPLTWVTN